MWGVFRLLTGFCFLLPTVQFSQAQGDANAEICSGDNDSVFSPEQRISACTALIDANKGSPQELAALLVSRGAIYWFNRNTSHAIADLDRALALDPKNARAYRERSNAFRSSGRLDRALADANEAIRLDPEDAEAFDNRGNVFNNNRQYDRAIADYNEALRLKPHFAQALLDRGAAHYFKAEYTAAIADYDEALKLDPKRADIYANRGAAYKKVGRSDRAIQDENEAIKLEPTTPEFFDNRGLSHVENGNYDLAIADFSEAIRLAPQANFLTNRGDAYNHRGELDRAIADYDRALKLNPGFVRAYHNRGVAFHDKGDLEHAIADFEQALRIDPHMDSAAEMLATVRQERDRRDNISESLLPTFNCALARRAVEKAICSDPDLSRLDRQIDDAYKAALAKLDRKGVERLRREQRQFNLVRDKSFGDPKYHLKAELERRLSALRMMNSEANRN